MARAAGKLVAAILRSPVHDLISRSVALIEWTGRRTGRPGATPVNFARDGDSLLVVSRAPRQWWRNVRAHPEVRVWLDGGPRMGSAAMVAPADVPAALATVLAAAGARNRAPDWSGEAVALRIALAPAPPVPPPLRGMRLVAGWTLASAAGELCGFFVPALCGALATAAGLEGVAVWLIMIAAGAVEGALLGLGQAFALRRALPAVRTIAWVRATVFGAMAAWAVGMLPSTAGDRLDSVPTALAIALAVPLGCAGLLAMGWLQARVLHGHVDRAWRWVPATAAAWAAGLGAGALVWSRWSEGQPVATIVAIGIAGALLMALAMGVVAGAALARLAGRPARAVIP